MTEPDESPLPAGGPAQPTPEQYAERARRADKSTKLGLAAVLGLEAVVVLLIPRAIAFSTGLGPLRTTLCIVLAVVLIGAAGVVRRRWGIAVGSLLQLPVLATGLLIGTMFLLGGLFIAVWLRLLLLRHELVGSPAGLRMFAG